MFNHLSYYGIKLEFVDFGTLQQAKIELLKNYTENNIQINHNKHNILLPEYFLISVNRKTTDEEQFAAVAHELAHFFCEHLSPPKENWWKVRNKTHAEMEFEAETVAWLVCKRRGIINPSDKYLSGYLDKDDQIPNISLEMIMKATNKIESLLNPMSYRDGFLAKKDELVKKQLQAIKK